MLPTDTFTNKDKSLWQNSAKSKRKQRVFFLCGIWKKEITPRLYTEHESTSSSKLPELCIGYPLETAVRLALCTGNQHLSSSIIYSVFNFLNMYKTKT